MAPPGEVDSQILRQRQFVIVFQHNRLADGQLEPPGPVAQDIRRDDIQDSLVLLLADLTQAAVAGQDLGTGHQWRPWRRDGVTGGCRASKREGSRASKRRSGPGGNPTISHPFPQDEAECGLAGKGHGEG